jgi:hypothetical protein
MAQMKTALWALVLLAGCSGNPIDYGTGGGGGDGEGSQEGVPEQVAVNLREISYDPSGAGTLKVNMDGLLASPLVADFVRTPTLDIDGYRAFIYQETALQRSHLAFVSENARGNLQAGVVADGGQFNRHFGGGHFARIDSFTRPTVRQGVETGQFGYAGSYAGVFLPGPLSVTPSGLPDGLKPNVALRTRGDVLIDANFANDLVNGGITNRVLLSDSGRVLANLEGLALPSTAIDENGQFLGDVEFAGAPDQAIGNYGGAFGGLEASDVAGVLVVNPIRGEDGIWEYGVFNLPRCDLAGASPLCTPR